MRLLILSQYYKPEPIPKPSDLAQGLKERGHEVTVITGFPSYPNGRLYEGYRLRLLKKETIDGIPVIRTFEYAYHGRRAIGRFLNYLTFMLSAPLGLFFAPPFDVIYVWHPPLTVGIAAWMISFIRRVPFVYDVQDIWPEAAVLSGILKPGFVVRCLSRIEKFVYSRAAHLLVVTQGAKDNLVSKGVRPEKITPMPHWIDEKMFASPDESKRQEVRREKRWDGRFVVLFAGNLGLVQGLDTVIECAELCAQEAGALFVFIGDGSNKSLLIDLAKSKGLLERNIQFIERQPMEKMHSFFCAADVLLVHLKHSELSNYVIPSKTMAYLASGKPILMAMAGAAADLVREANAGLVVAPECPSAMAAGVRALAAMTSHALHAFGENGKSYLLNHFAKPVVVPLYESLLLQVARA